MRSPSIRIATVLLSVITGCTQLIDVPQAFDAKAGAGGDGGESTAGKGSGGQTTKGTGGATDAGGSSSSAPQGGAGGSSNGATGGTTATGGLGGTSGSDLGGNGGTANGGTANGGTTFSGPPSVESFTVEYNKVCSGNPAKLRAVFSNGTGTVDGGVGELSSGVDKLTSAITANTTYTLTVTGSEGQKVTKSVDVTALPSGKFTPTGAPNGVIFSDYFLPRWAALMPNGRVLVITQNTSAKFQFEEYDLSAGQFAVVGAATPGRGGQPISLEDGRALIAGHWGTNAELFEPSSGTLTKAASMSLEREYAQGLFLPDRKAALIVGGSWAGETVMYDSAELYDPKTNSFTLIAMQGGRVSNSTTLLLDGKVLVSGGINWYGPSFNSAEVFDPAQGTNGKFTLTGSLNESRGLHSAVLLESGRVLISGGDIGTGGAPLASAEIYDPSTGKFTTTGSLNYGRSMHQMVLLQNGRVLVYGGRDKSGAVPFPEIYSEGVGKFTLPGLTRLPSTIGGATSLANGVVLIAGVDNTSKPSAELYCP
jgi:hypothetical protein